MEIILLKQYKNLGKPGDLAQVKTGYAKNYLVPMGIAQYATKKNREALKQNLDILMSNHQDKLNDAQEVKSVLHDKIFTVIRNASDDHRLYGSVTTKDVHQMVSDFVLNAISRKLELSKSGIDLGPGIKSLGMYGASINIYSNINANITLNVCRSENEAAINLANLEKEKNKNLKSKAKSDSSTDTALDSPATEGSSYQDTVTESVINESMDAEDAILEE